jgi:DivIVA domain-containing protein
MITAGLNWLTADDVRTKAFSNRRGNYPADEVRAFLDHLATLMDARNERMNQLEDQLMIAESDHRAALELQRALAVARGEMAALKDRVALAETVREDAVRRLKQLLDEAKGPKARSEQSLALDSGTEGGEDTHEIVSQALAASERTRSDAHKQAQHIIDEAVRSADNVRREQQRWADEAELALRTRLDELSAETDIQLADAREAAARMLTAAADEATRIVGHASTEADRLVSEARAFSSAWFATPGERCSGLDGLDTARRGPHGHDTDEPEQTPAAATTGTAAADAAKAGSPAPTGEGGQGPDVVNAETLLAKAAQLVSAAALMSPITAHRQLTDLLDGGVDEMRRGSHPSPVRKAGDGDAPGGTERG